MDDKTPGTPAAATTVTNDFAGRAAIFGIFALIASLCVAVGVGALLYVGSGFAREVLVDHRQAQRADDAANQPPAVVVVRGPDGRFDIDPGILTLPTNNQIVTSVMHGFLFSSLHTKNENDAALSTTVIEALDEDLAAAEQTEQYTQIIRICNYDTTDHMCLGSDPSWAAACNAGDLTCRAGATTDGAVIKADTCRELHLRGTERPCLLGVAAISSYDVERITSRGSEY